MKTNNTFATLSATTAAAVAFANAPKPAEDGKAAKVAPIMTGTFAMPIPAEKATNRGSKSPYPFETLEVGHAFGVKNKTAKQLSSIVSNQNRKDANHRPIKDENGNIKYKMTDLTGPDGSVTKVPTKEPETEQIKAFAAYDVSDELKKQIKGTPLEGSSVLVFRTK